MVWALGRLDKNNEPSFHDLYPRRDVIFDLGCKEPENTCIHFTENNKKYFQRCERLDITDLLLLFHRYNVAFLPGSLGKRPKYLTEALELLKQLSDHLEEKGDTKVSQVKTVLLIPELSFYNMLSDERFDYFTCRGNVSGYRLVH